MSGESLTQAGREAAIADAKADGFSVVHGNPYRLLLDLDTPQAIEQFDRVLPVVQQRYGIPEIDRWESKSGNTHVLLTFTQPIPDVTTRLLLQAALGSDGIKEVLALYRMGNGISEPSILFKPTKEWHDLKARVTRELAALDLGG